MASLPSDPANIYNKHIFCCANLRPPGHPRSCCADRGSIPLMEYMAKRIDEIGLADVRVEHVGCMERCELGPSMVIYPEAIWYTFETEKDVDEIIERHVQGGEVIERLQLEVDRRLPKAKSTETLALTVTESKDETDRIKSFVLSPKPGEQLPTFEAGAHIDVVTGNGLRRSYSLANDPTDRDHYLIGVLREAESRGGSVWMHDALKTGDDLTIVAPRNNFPLAEDAAEHLLIAGGIGITPILAMGRTLKARDANFHLAYCTRSREDTAFLEEIEAVFGDRVTLVHDGGDPSCGIDLVTHLKDRPDGAHVYVCGPASLIAGTRAAAAHWPAETVHYELFSSAPDESDWVNEPFEIYLSRRKQELVVPADKSILEVVREAGVFVDSSCESGLCSTCMVRLISGEAEHRDHVLNEAELETGDRILTCVSRAKPGEKLVLDL